MKLFFFNLATLEAHSKGNAEIMVETLRLHYLKKLIPKSRHSKIKPLSNLVGSSFLVNAEDFFNDQTTDIMYKSQYIQLAGRRDYGNYKYYDTKYLDLSYFQDIDLNKIKTNPLLTTANQKIYFKYEELQNGTQL